MWSMAVRYRSALLSCALAAATCSVACAAGPAAALAVQGRVASPQHLSADELRQLPPVTVAIDDAGHAPAQRHYTGALLWTLVTQAGPVDEPGHKTHLKHTLLAIGRDGYAVAFSIAEIDPAFEGKQVLVAYSQDGKALDGLRLIVPGDGKAGRSVRDLVEIDLY